VDVPEAMNRLHEAFFSSRDANAGRRAFA